MSSNWKFAVAPLLVFAAALSSPLATAASEAGPAKIISMTRTGVMFSALEKSLDAAARNKDQAGLAKLLSEDFELRESATPGQPVPRADWLARAGGAGTMALSQVGVHDFGDTAVVSFSMSGAHGMAAGSTIFVVDVWHRVNGQWQLAVRFQPTSGSATETGDVKPDGKG